jgi:aminoglycoside phosphotransferase (APT) family kinase protein
VDTQDISLSPDILRYAERLIGQAVTIESVETSALKGGYVTKAVYRHRLKVRALDGTPGEISVVAKPCAAAEVHIMRHLLAVQHASALPALISAMVSDDVQGHGTSWLVAPFYEGQVLTFADPIPDEVIRSLAHVHAVLAEVRDVAWTWTFNADHMRRTLEHAIEAVSEAVLFRHTTPDHADWHTRLKNLRHSRVLFKVSDALEKTLTHGDMHPGNIIRQSEGQPVILDWGNVCLAPPPLDLANIIRIDSPLWAVYLDTYRGAGGKIDEASLRTGYYWARAATGLQYLPWIAAHLPTAPAMIAQVLEAEETLRRLSVA